MKQQPYDTTKRKIDTFQNSEIDKSIRVAKQSNINNNEIIRVQDANILQYEHKKKIDFSSNWELINPIDYNNNTLIDYAHLTFIQELDQFDIRLIPYLNFQILVRPGNGDIDDSEYFIQVLWQFNYFIEITDITGEDFFKKVKIVASVYTNNDTPLQTIPYYAKLVSTFVNPRNYN